MICVRKTVGKRRCSAAAHEHNSSSSLISRNDMAQQCERLLSNHAAHDGSESQFSSYGGIGQWREECKEMIEDTNNGKSAGYQDSAVGMEKNEWGEHVMEFQMLNLKYDTKILCVLWDLCDCLINCKRSQNWGNPLTRQETTRQNPWLGKIHFSHRDAAERNLAKNGCRNKLLLPFIYAAIPWFLFSCPFILQHTTFA